MIFTLVLNVISLSMSWFRTINSSRFTMFMVVIHRTMLMLMLVRIKTIASIDTYLDLDTYLDSCHRACLHFV